MYRTTQDENVDVDILKVCEGTPTTSLLNIASARYQCLSKENEYTLFDSQQPYMYDTRDYWQSSEQVALKIRPCVFDGSNSCADSAVISDYFETHPIRLSIRQFDDLGNIYWIEEALPTRGKAITLFIREISTMDEDYYFMTTKPWLGLDDAGGRKTVQVVSKVINGHDPNPGQLLGDSSVTIYLR